MNIEDIITFEDNKEYLILDIVELNNDKYMYCVGIDNNEEPTEEYIYLKSIEEDGEFYTEEVTDQNILNAIVTMFTNNYMINSTNDEQDV